MGNFDFNILKMIKIGTIFLTISFLSISCSNNSYESSSINSNHELTLNKSYIFDTGFRSPTIIKKTFLLDNEEFVAFSNFETHKKIVLHSLDSKNTIHIPLDEIISKKEKIMSFDITSKDSIFIRTQYTNRIYLINGLGEILDEIDCNNFLSQYEGGIFNFEFSGNSNPFMINDTTLICSLTPYLQDDEPFNFVNYYEKLHQLKIPYFVKIDNIFNEKSNVSFGLFNFYDNFSSKESFRLEIKKWNFIDSNIFVSSFYSDTIYVVSTNTLNIKTKIPIKSKLIEDAILTTEILLSDVENGLNYNEHINASPRFSSLVNYDKFKNQYWVGLKEPKKHKNIILILDSNFNYSQELELDTMYSGFNCLTNEGSIIVSDYLKYKDSSYYYQTNSFSILNYDIKKNK